MLFDKKIGIITVGDEILSGHVLDSNTNWLLKQLDGMNHEVERVEVVPDVLESISNSVKRFIEEKFDVLLVCGGIGPTHDDVTVESVAHAVNTDLEENEEAINFIDRQYRKFHQRKILKASSIEEVPGARKMAMIPKGAILLEPMGTAPGILIRHRDGDHQIMIFILPGVPQEHHAMFETQIKYKYLDPNPKKKYTKEIISRTEEARLFPLLTKLKKEFPDVKIGSYPNIEMLHVKLRLKGKKDRVEEASELIYKTLEQLHPG
jgi:molybdenum cofactor synthesis domain-containing protein